MYLTASRFNFKRILKCKILLLFVISVLFFLYIGASQQILAANVTPKSATSDNKTSEPSCHLREMDLCLASVAIFTQNQNGHPINEAEINRQCKILNETESCISNFTSRCLTDHQAQLVDMFAHGSLDNIREFCKPHSKLRTLYLKHGTCVNAQNKAQKLCVRDFQSSLEKMSDMKEWTDRPKLACCAYNRLQACTHDAIEPKCGSEALEVAESFTRATFSRLPKVTCAKYEHNGKQCAALLPPAGTIPKGAKSHSVLSKIFSTYSNS